MKTYRYIFAIIFAVPLFFLFITKAGCQTSNLVVSHNCLTFNGTPIYDCAVEGTSANFDANLVIDGTCTSGIPVSAQQYSIATGCTKPYELQVYGSVFTAPAYTQTCPVQTYYIGDVTATSYRYSYPNAIIQQTAAASDTCGGIYFESLPGSYIGPPC